MSHTTNPPTSTTTPARERVSAASTRVVAMFLGVRRAFSPSVRLARGSSLVRCCSLLRPARILSPPPGFQGTHGEEQQESGKYEIEDQVVGIYYASGEVLEVVCQ